MALGELCAQHTFRLHTVKAIDFPLPSVLRPQVAGNAVKRASDNLVRAAQKAAFGKADDDDVVVKTKFVGGIAQVSLLPAAPPHFLSG